MVEEELAEYVGSGGNEDGLPLRGGILREGRFNLDAGGAWYSKEFGDGNTVE